MKHEILFKPNNLIRGIFDVNSNEYKTFNMILQKTQLKIQKTDIDLREIKDNESVSTKITLKEFQEIFKNKNENTLREIGITLKKLEKTSITFKDRDNKLVIASLIGKIKLDDEEKNIECFIDSEVLKILVAYKEVGYAPIDLTMTKKAKGYYSQRFYELFRSWNINNLKCKKVDFEELKVLLALENHNSYKSFRTFKSAVLEPVVKELNKNFNMVVTYDVERVVKKVKSIIFYINDLEPRNYNFNLGRIDSDGNKPLASKMDLDYALNNKSIVEGVNLKEKPLLAERTLKELAKKYGEDEVSISYEILKERNSIEKIKAPKKYIIGILDNRKKDSQRPLNRVNNKPSNFNNFTQREYDYEKLERQLLGWASDEEYEDD